MRWAAHVTVHCSQWQPPPAQVRCWFVDTVTCSECESGSATPWQQRGQHVHKSSISKCPRAIIAEQRLDGVEAWGPYAISSSAPAFQAPPPPSPHLPPTRLSAPAAAGPGPHLRAPPQGPTPGPAHLVHGAAGEVEQVPRLQHLIKAAGAQLPQLKVPRGVPAGRGGGSGGG